MSQSLYFLHTYAAREMTDDFLLAFNKSSPASSSSNIYNAPITNEL